jgi:nicotinamide-nucleotide adenylyltransferase
MANERFDVGVVPGRFQVLHNDHMELLMAVQRRCRFLVAGISRPDPARSGGEPAGAARDQPSANPLSFFERHMLLRSALAGAGLDLDQFTAVPFPVAAPELYPWYAPPEAVFFLAVYDEWGRRKRELLESGGLRVEVVREANRELKGLSGKRIRERMAEGDPWEHLVPAATVDMLKQWRVPQRVSRLLEQDA